MGNKMGSTVLHKIQVILPPEISTRFMDMTMMANPSKGVCMDAEIAATKAWVELLRPLRQVTVRQQSTKDKTDTLPIILYKNEEPYPELVDVDITDNEYDREIDSESAESAVENNDVDKQGVLRISHLY